MSRRVPLPLPLASSFFLSTTSTACIGVRCQDQTWPEIRRYHAALLFPLPFLSSRRSNDSTLLLLFPCDDGDPCEARPALSSSVSGKVRMSGLVVRLAVVGLLLLVSNKTIGKSMVKKPRRHYH
jgi:hypothetical protein